MHQLFIHHELAKLGILGSEDETLRTNLISVERVVNEDAATVGVIGIQTRNVFVCPPLMCFPFNASSQSDQRVSEILFWNNVRLMYKKDLNYMLSVVKVLLVCYMPIRKPSISI